MKKIFAFSAFVLTVLLFATCDKIEGPFFDVLNSEEVTVEFPEIDPSTVYRKILFEEFTAHYCQNCPSGHQTLESLHQQYGDTLVAVGIHCTPLADPRGTLYSYNFRTDAGDEIGETFGIESIPAAIINRCYVEGGISRSQWFNEVRALERTQASAAIQLINEYDDVTEMLKANVKVTMLKDYSSPLRLGIFLLEDGVVKPQKDGNQDIENYIHNHVLRASFTDPFGMSLREGSSSWKAGDTELYASSLDFSATDWVAYNCSVVAFLYDPDKREVIQVEKVNVINR